MERGNREHKIEQCEFSYFTPLCGVVPALGTKVVAELLQLDVDSVHDVLVLVQILQKTAKCSVQWPVPRAVASIEVAPQR